MVRTQALSTLPCTEVVWNGHGYRFCSDLRTWAQARSECQAQGMDLASIDSSSENTFVLSKMALGGWIGATDSADEGTWLWISSGQQFWSGGALGSPVAGRYANWLFGEPNDIGNDDCGFLQAVTGKWQDAGCGWFFAYACESAADQCPADPAKVTPGQCGCGAAETDSDGDGVANCLDGCPDDSAQTEPGDCGCASAPAPSGTACDDGVCAGVWVCNGAGVCGEPALCAPDSNCIYKRSTGGRVYWFCANPRTWTDARDRCRTLPGVDLADITEPTENQLVGSTITCSSWLGGNDRDSSGRWQWAARPFDVGELFWTGGSSGAATPGSIAMWKTGEPSAGAGEDCLYVNTGAGDQQRWFDGSCGTHRGFVCEQAPDLCKDNPAKSLPGVCGCAVADVDTDADGTFDCLDACPNDPLRTEPGDCGCVGAPSPLPAGTPCNDGVSPSATQCDGAGSCGSVSQSPPDTNCSAVVFGRRVYWLCRNNRLWSDAAAKCQNEPRTRLVRIDSAVENDFLAQQIAADSWIGGTDSAVEGKWLWSGTGTQFWSGSAQGSNSGGLFSAWESSEPDNLLNQDCAQLSRSSGRWVDRSCLELRDFVCETCVPRSCAELNAQCGTIDDGCGGALDCSLETGGCTPPDVCFPAVNRCSDPEGKRCRQDIKRDSALPPEDASRKFWSQTFACTSTDLDSCQAALLGALRDDDVRTADACSTGRITPSDHNTLNFDRNDKRRAAQLDPTYACRVAAGDIDRDFIPDDADQCLDTPPRTATLANGCTDPARAPGPDAGYMQFLRSRHKPMYDPACIGMDMSFVPINYGFDPPPGASSDKFLYLSTVNRPPNCDLFFELRADALLDDGTRGSYHILFTREETSVSHLDTISYISFKSTDPGDRGALARSRYQDLIYTYRVRNGNGMASYWSEPTHAGAE